MSVDLTTRGLRRVPDTTGSNTQAADDNSQQNPSVHSQPETVAPKVQNQNAEAANSRKAEAGMRANQVQSQLLNHTISTGANRTNNKPGANAADLQRALKMYGITNEQLQRYVTTGEEPEGLKKAINDAESKGEWPAVNVVRGSFQKRAEYLRANSGPNDKKSRAEADQLDTASANLTRNRQEIATKHAVDQVKSSNYSKNPVRAEKQVAQATKNLQDISSEMENHLKARKKQ